MADGLSIASRVGVDSLSWSTSKLRVPSWFQFNARSFSQSTSTLATITAFVASMVSVLLLRRRLIESNMIELSALSGFEGG